MVTSPLRSLLHSPVSDRISEVPLYCYIYCVLNKFTHSLNRSKCFFLLENDATESLEYPPQDGTIVTSHSPSDLPRCMFVTQNAEPPRSELLRMFFENVVEYVHRLIDFYKAMLQFDVLVYGALGSTALSAIVYICACCSCPLVATYFCPYFKYFLPIFLKHIFRSYF